MSEDVECLKKTNVGLERASSFPSGFREMVGRTSSFSRHLQKFCRIFEQISNISEKDRPGDAYGIIHKKEESDQVKKNRIRLQVLELNRLPCHFSRKMLPGSSVVLMFPLSLRNMNQQVVLESSQKERTTFGTLPEGLVPPIVKFVRRWAEKEQTGKDWRVRIDLGRM